MVVQYRWANGQYQMMGYAFILQPAKMQGDGQAIIVAWDHVILEMIITAILTAAWHLLNRRFGSDNRSSRCQAQGVERFP